METEPFSNVLESTFNIIIDKNEKMSENFSNAKSISTEISMETSIDLLYIVDITGSIYSYFEEIKNRLIQINKNIKSKCLGIEINIGFIGFKDFHDLKRNDNYVDINFTKNDQEINEKIKKVQTGGGGDTCEDLTGAMEMAKFKNWTSNAKYAILITDAPCHGKKYHNDNEIDDFPDGDPLNRNIEDYIGFLAKSKINLCCIKITEKTDIMFRIFENIYKKYEKYGGILKIEPLNSFESLSELIVKDCTETYFVNRFVKKL